MKCEKCKEEHGKRVQYKSKTGLNICWKCYKEEDKKDK